MNIHEIAADFTALCAKGAFEEAEKYWADDVVSLEPFPGDMASLQGREAIKRKHERWENSHTVHSCTVMGPFLHGDQFAVRFTLDVTQPNGVRSIMEEVGVYTVKDGRITEERFFFL